MTKDDVQQLGRLARITLTDEEVSRFQHDIDQILDYVSTIQTLVEEETAAPAVPVHHNVLRTDEVTNEPGVYSDTLLKAAPHSDGRFVAVKKILQTDE